MTPYGILLCSSIDTIIPLNSDHIAITTSSDRKLMCGDRKRLAKVKLQCDTMYNTIVETRTHALHPMSSDLLIAQSWPQAMTH